MVLPVPETALNKIPTAEYIINEPKITFKDGMVASINSKSSVNIPSITLGIISATMANVAVQIILKPMILFNNENK